MQAFRCISYLSHSSKKVFKIQHKQLFFNKTGEKGYRHIWKINVSLTIWLLNINISFHHLMNKLHYYCTLPRRSHGMTMCLSFNTAEVVIKASPSNSEEFQSQAPYVLKPPLCWLHKSLVHTERHQHTIAPVTRGLATLKTTGSYNKPFICFCIILHRKQLIQLVHYSPKKHIMQLMMKHQIKFAILT